MDKIKLLVWKLRFTRRIYKRTIEVPLIYCWQCAEAAIETLGEDWKDECPIDSADEELSCWSD